MNPKTYICAVCIALLAIIFFSVPAKAQEIGPGETPPPTKTDNSDHEIPEQLDQAFDGVLNTIRRLGESVIKFLIFGGGILFTIGFVYSAMTGTIGQAIGNQSGVSQSVVRAISVLFGFLFLLASYNVATFLAHTITNEALVQNHEWVNFDGVMKGNGGNQGQDVPPEDVLQSSAINDVVIDLADSVVKFMIGLGGIFFILAIVRGAFDTQLGTLLGGSNMASTGIMRAAGAVGAFLFLATSFALSQNLVQLLVPRLVGSISLGT